MFFNQKSWQHPKVGVSRWHWHTNRQTHRHGDSMTESVEVEVWLKYHIRCHSQIMSATKGGREGAWKMLTLDDKGGWGSWKLWQHWQNALKRARTYLFFKLFLKPCAIFTNYGIFLVFFGHWGRVGKARASKTHGHEDAGPRNIFLNLHKILTFETKTCKTCTFSYFWHHLKNIKKENIYIYL